MNRKIVTSGALRVTPKEGAPYQVDWIAYEDPRRLGALIDKARNNRTGRAKVSGTLVLSSGSYSWDLDEVRLAARQARLNKSGRANCGALVVQIVK